MATEIAQVETAVKTDVTSELAKLKADYANDVAKLKADYAKLKTETFSFITLVYTGVGAFIAGVIIGVILHSK
jgi:hypothetical protein